MDKDLTTPRLRLRRLRAADAARIRDLCGNWNVARMLARVPHPYPEGLAETWIAGQPEAWRTGNAYTFAIELEGELIGVIGIERRESGGHELGYWLGEPWWGRGFMTETVGRLVRFAADDLKLDTLASNHFSDNPASGRVQANCGFRQVGRGRLACLARGGKVDAIFTARRLVKAC